MGLFCFVAKTSMANGYKNSSPDILVYDQLGKQSLKLKLSLDHEIFSLYLKSEFALCIPSDARLEITLKNNTVVQTYSVFGDNCEGILQVSFGGIHKKEYVLNQLGRSEIKSLYFMDEYEEHLIYLTDEQSNQIKHQINKIAGANYKSI